MERIRGKAYENITFYESDTKGRITKAIEELADPIGEITVSVHDIFELNLDLLPEPLIDLINRNPKLYHLFSYIFAVALTDPSDYHGKTVRAYKTEDYSQALFVAKLVSEWLGGAYIIVEEKGKGRKMYYIWSMGTQYYLHEKEVSPVKAQV